MTFSDSICLRWEAEDNRKIFILKKNKKQKTSNRQAELIATAALVCHCEGLRDPRFPILTLSMGQCGRSSYLHKQFPKTQVGQRPKRTEKRKQDGELWLISSLLILSTPPFSKYVKCLTCLWTKSSIVAWHTTSSVLWMKAGRWNVIWKQITIDRQSDVNMSRSKWMSLVVEFMWAVFDQTELLMGFHLLFRTLLPLNLLA